MDLTLLAYSKFDGQIDGTDNIATAGALSCRAQKDTADILSNLYSFAKEEIVASDPEKYPEVSLVSNEKAKEWLDGVIPASFGRGHGSVGDQSWFAFSVKSLPRLATLQLCSSEYFMHLQQSLRFAKADGGVYQPAWLEDAGVKADHAVLTSDVFNFYEKAIKKNVPAEDARYPLPLDTLTNIFSSGNAREFNHIRNMNAQGEVPSIVQKTIDDMIYKAKEVAPKLFGKQQMLQEVLAYWPASQLFSKKNQVMNRVLEDKGIVRKPTRTGADTEFSKYIVKEELEAAIKNRDEAYLSNLKHVHATYLVPMSIASYHQMIRQRTLNQAIESVYAAADRAMIVIPPKIESAGLMDDYIDLTKRQIEFYTSSVKSGINRAEVVGVLPHSLQLYDLIHVNGWNALHFIGKRKCKTAQWEIRGYAHDIADDFEKLFPAYEGLIAAQGQLYGKCPEREPCAKLCPTFSKTNEAMFRIV